VAGSRAVRRGGFSYPPAARHRAFSGHHQSIHRVVRRLRVVLSILWPVTDRVALAGGRFRWAVYERLHFGHAHACSSTVAIAAVASRIFDRDNPYRQRVYPQCQTAIEWHPFGAPDHFLGCDARAAVFRGYAA
jgi:hypothetical protein